MLVLPSGGDSGYKLQRSLRFRSSASAYLSRTPAGAGNRRTFTWSGFVKLGAVGNNPGSFLMRPGNTDADYFRIAYSPSNANRLFVSAYNTATFQLETTAVFRDPSAWYHIIVAVDTTQATASNRCKIYVNGIQLVDFSTANYPVQNFDTALNTTASHEIGKIGALYFDGLLAEVNFIDGQALTPSSFGAFDAITGVWAPAKYTGSYGTNGFYLPFTDNTALTTASNVGLGKDFSGNGNYWVTNNISITAGATYDSFTDVPTLTSKDAANFCVLNPLSKGVSVSGVALSNSNLKATCTSDSVNSVLGTIGVSSGKWYWEVTPVADGAQTMLGVGNSSAGASGVFPGIDANSWGYYGDGSKYHSSSAAYGAAFGNLDVLGTALDMGAGTLTFYKNGVSQGQAYTGITGEIFPMIGEGGTVTATAFEVNFGQRPFTYTPPTGFLALNTFNLPDSTIKAGNKYFDVVTRNGMGPAGGSVTSLAFQPDMIWDKQRNVANNHYIRDSVRGTNLLVPNTTQAEIADSNWFLSLNPNGYTVGSSDWGVSSTLVDWCWKKGATPGFDIVAYTGNSTAGRTVSHALGVTPKFMVIKSRNVVRNWIVYHANMDATPQNGYLSLNQSIAYAALSGIWNNTAPTSSVFSLGTDMSVNFSAENYVAYLWSEIPGFSKFGSYTGNGSTDGPFVYCGFRPRYVMVKCTSNSPTDWGIFDSARDSSNDAAPQLLYADLTDAETTILGVDLLSNGFKLRNVSQVDNNSGWTYIYAAFAENPFRNALAR